MGCLSPRWHTLTGRGIDQRSHSTKLLVPARIFPRTILWTLTICKLARSHEGQPPTLARTSSSSPRVHSPTCSQASTTRATFHTRWRLPPASVLLKIISVLRQIRTINKSLSKIQLNAQMQKCVQVVSDAEIIAGFFMLPNNLHVWYHNHTTHTRKIGLGRASLGATSFLRHQESFFVNYHEGTMHGQKWFSIFCCFSSYYSWFQQVMWSTLQGK